MSINKPGAFAPQPSITPAAPGPVGPETVTRSADAGPVVRTHQPTPDADWRDLPDEVVGRLMNILKEEVLSAGLTPDERSTALSALLNLGSTSRRDQQVLNHLLDQTRLDRQRLREAVMEARRSHWLAEADHLEAQREQLRDDFSVTRELIIEAKRTNTAVVLPEDREGIEFCFDEIEFGPSISTLMSTLNGKTAKLDASGIGRDRFMNEILPALEKIPSGCNVVLDASANDLTSNQLAELVSLMAKKGNIYRLDLSRNPLAEGESGDAQLVNLFKHAGPMTHLYLSETGFSNAAADLLKKTPLVTTMLQQLDLRDNQLHEAGVIDVMQALVPATEDSGVSCPSLQLLRFAGNPCETTSALIREKISTGRRIYKMNQPMEPRTEERQGDPDAPAALVLGGSPPSLGLSIELPAEEDGFVGELRAELIAKAASEGRL